MYTDICQILTVTQANQKDWPNETKKICSIEVIETAARAQLSDFLSLNLPMCLSTCTALFFLLLSTLLSSLLYIIVEILFCEAKGPGPLSLTTGLVARIW